MPKNRPVQIFDQDRLSRDRSLSKTEIARFISDFQKLVAGNQGKRKLISLRVPENILSQFKAKALKEKTPYQTQIVNLMKKWVYK